MIVLKKYFLLFIIYSVLGWIMESCWTFINKGKFVKRGVLLGPYCPIYGCGVLLLVVLLDNFKTHPFYLFFLSILICSVLEYFGSFVLEKMFGARWWDYTHYKFNLNGRICAETMIPFGIMGSIIVYYLNPYFVSRINFDNSYVYIFIFLFVLDIVVSYFVLNVVKYKLKNVDSDNTEEVFNNVLDVLFKKSR